MQRRFVSAIWKHPAAGPVRVLAEGLEGDAVANRRYHGGPDQALLAYAAAHYPHWEAEWGGDALAPGAFGENLTVEGMDENAACIGDVVEIGNVRLEVTQPREPCATLARRHGRRDLVRTVLRNGRGGWYLRVLTPGKIEAGLPIVLSARPAPEWTVRRALQVRADIRNRQREARELAGLSALGSRFRAALVHGLRADG